MQRVAALCLSLSVLTLAGCEQGTTPAPANAPTTASISAADPDLQLKQEHFANTLGLSAYMAFSTAAQSAQQLDAQIAKFLHTPTAASLAATQQAWRQAYSDFLRTAVFAKLPLLDPNEWTSKGIDYQQTLVQLDSWPIAAGYIDYVEGYPYSGIVNDLALPLTPNNLIEQHGFADPSYASLGFHALEFMLWGEYGTRQASDFQARDNTRAVVSKNEEAPLPSNSLVEAPSPARNVQNQHRRRLYLQLVSDQLQKHIHRLQRRFEPSNGHYASLLQQAKPAAVVQASLLATQKLLSDELLGKRLEGNSSEFSHSSWADNVALIDSVRQLFFAHADAAQQLWSPELVTQWQTALDKSSQCFTQWQGEAAVTSEQRVQCRQDLIELLLILKQSAKTLHISLPSLN